MKTALHGGRLVAAAWLGALSASCSGDGAQGFGVGEATGALTDPCAGGQCGSWARPSRFTGRLVYQPDAQGDRIPDFSPAGYRGGGVTFVAPPVAATLSGDPQPSTPCSARDRATEINQAIATAAQRAPDATGKRGTVTLGAGHYTVGSQINLASGVALVGAGSSTTGTVLHHCHFGGDPVTIRAAGSGGVTTGSVVGTLIEKLVPVGARSFLLGPGQAAPLSPGDPIVVVRAGTAAFISAIGMDRLESVGAARGITDVNDWGPFSHSFERRVTRVEGDRVFIDNPITNAIEAAAGYSTGQVRRITGSQRAFEMAVMNLRGIYEGSGAQNDLTASLVSVANAENVWVQGVTAAGYPGNTVASTGKYVTVTQSRYELPKGPISGGYRYPFVLGGAFSLVEGSTANDARHDFVPSARSAGPIVFRNSSSTNSKEHSGPHHRWAGGALFDNVSIAGDSRTKFESTFAPFRGTGHGWTGANNVYWNCRAPSFYVVNPPTAQNWVIGSTGSVVWDPAWTWGSPYPAFGFPAPYQSAPEPAHQERINQAVSPASLYAQQRQDGADLDVYVWAGGSGSWSNPEGWEQKATPAPRRVEVRDYVIGDIDDFRDDGAADASSHSGGGIHVDPGFVTRIQQSSSLPIVGLDTATGNRNVAFTFRHRLDPSDRVIHASLALSLRDVGGSPGSDFVQIEGSAAQTFSSLGWLPYPAGGKVVRVLDLGDRLAQVNTGTVNVRVNDDSAVDFALLSLTTAVTQPGGDPPNVTFRVGSDVRLDTAAQVGSVIFPGALRVVAGGDLTAEVVGGNSTSAALHMQGGRVTAGSLIGNGPIHLHVTGGAAPVAAPIRATTASLLGLVVVATGTLVPGQVVNAVEVSGGGAALPYATSCFDSAPSYRHVPCRAEIAGNTLRVVVSPRTAAIRYGEGVVLQSKPLGTYIGVTGNVIGALHPGTSTSSTFAIVRAAAPTATGNVVLNGEAVAIRHLVTGKYLGESGTAATLESSITAAARWKVLKDSCACADGSTVTPGTTNFRIQAVQTVDHLKSRDTGEVVVLSGAGDSADWRFFDAPLFFP